MDAGQPNFFSGPYLDRRAEEREDADWARAALEDPQTLYLLGSGTRHLVYTQPEPRIAFLDPGMAAVLAADDHSRLVLLGWFRERRCVLVEVGDDPRVELPRQASFEELRPLSPLLAGEEAGLLAYARALSIWRVRQRYCGACGAPTVPQRAGHCMRCSRESCAQEFFPRLDPAIIVLVTDGERALLGRQATWPQGRYSTIAGFVEPGESLEDAVAREVLEETGVPVASACYDSSQPWPFPASVMIGFRAQARPGSAARVSGELEDARWFTREEIRAGGAALLPFSHSISHRLIVTWLEEQPSCNGTTP
ncbi:MAG TPA: NAD(+) diphosphatase [Steroidobacteraceae bacterium]|jgi:NAD+ diphosphatase|nr:NAD(+) diphosphatase [Steroidobacteraceae bacterium]